ncbi:MAG: TetR/AcrR family transcriptional regulator [Rhodospirillales bacterium]|nr:TetR/AcrR family transcriptional regulator [Rhodospirillales bacterium]MDK9719670.1 TetR/AcrR family transcriptional regulator [Rhodospirillales bacterium]
MGSRMPYRKSEGQESRRDEILRCAAEIFEAKGVGQTSIEDIAQAVGVKREAIYYYFKGRNEILAEIVLPQSTELLNAIQSILESEQSFPEKLKSAIKFHVGSLATGYLELTISMREPASISESERLEQLRGMWKSYSNAWADLVRQGQESGSFKPGLDPKMVAFGLLGMLNWMSRWYQPGKGASLEEIAQTYATLATQGLVED